MSETTTKNRDRTAEISFDTVDNLSVDALVNNRIIVMKDVIAAEGIAGVSRAYIAARRLALPRRVAAKGIASIGGEGTKLHEIIRARSVQIHPDRIPLVMRSADLAISSIVDLNDSFFSFPKIANTYPDSADLTIATFPINIGDEAFPLHQDSQGISGVGHALQPKATQWSIHRVEGNRAVDVDYTFETEPGDVVTLMGRVGPCPDVVVCGEGFDYVANDGSVPHSGVNLVGGIRHGLGLFHQDKAEI